MRGGVSAAPCVGTNSGGTEAKRTAGAGERGSGGGGGLASP